MHTTLCKATTRAGLIVALTALVGCQTQPPNYGQRRLTKSEYSWYQTMNEWYPTWQEPVRPIPPREAPVQRMSTTEASPVQTPVARVIEAPAPAPAPIPSAVAQPEPVAPTPAVQPVFDFPDQRDAAPSGSQPYRVIPQGAEPSGSNKSRPQWYSVQKGDTLVSIAKRFYGNAEAWRSIYQANQQTLSAPDRLKVGMRLRLP